MVKTITISDEAYEFIQRTAHELETQDNRHTQWKEGVDMYDEPITVKATDPKGPNAEVKIGNQLVRWKEIDIRIRLDEYIEMTVVVMPDQLDIAALQENTRLIVEDRATS